MRSESRKSIRRRVGHFATIARPDGSEISACVLVDVSASGARLSVIPGKVIAQEFVLILSPDGQVRRYCSVVWRSGTSIGVRFLSKPATNETKSWNIP